MKAFVPRGRFNTAYLHRFLRLAYLSPNVTAAILAGAATGVGGTGAMIAREAFPVGWYDQVRLMLGAWHQNGRFAPQFPPFDVVGDNPKICCSSGGSLKVSNWVESGHAADGDNTRLRSRSL